MYMWCGQLNTSVKKFSRVKRKHGKKLNQIRSGKTSWCARFIRYVRKKNTAHLHKRKEKSFTIIRCEKFSLKNHARRRTFFFSGSLIFHKNDASFYHHASSQYIYTHILTSKKNNHFKGWKKSFFKFIKMKTSLHILSKSRFHFFTINYSFSDDSNLFGSHQQHNTHTVPSTSNFIFSSRKAHL